MEQATSPAEGGTFEIFQETPKKLGEDQCTNLNKEGKWVSSKGSNIIMCVECDVSATESATDTQEGSH